MDVQVLNHVRLSGFGEQHNMAGFGSRRSGNRRDDFARRTITRLIKSATWEITSREVVWSESIRHDRPELLFDRDETSRQKPAKKF